jgi:hypothetical protein
MNSKPFPEKIAKLRRPDRVAEMEVGFFSGDLTQIQAGSETG